MAERRKTSKEVEKREIASRKDYLELLPEYKNSPVIDFIHRDIIYDAQIDLLGIPSKEYGLRVRQGRFFEKIVQGMVGGDKKKVYLMFPDYSHFSSAEFDIVNSSGKHIEVKSIRSDKEVKLSDEQNLDYALCLKHDLLEKAKTIDFYMFVHSLKDLQSNGRYRKSVEELVAEESKNILFGVSLPFSAIFKLWDPLVIHPHRIHTRGKKKGEEKYRWNDKDGSGKSRKYPQKTYTRLPSQLLERLLINPEEGLNSLSISPQYYEHERKICPEGIFVDSNPLPKFPMIFFRDKDVDQWNEEFKEINIVPYIDFVYKRKSNVIEIAKEESGNTLLEEKTENLDDSFDFGSNVKTA